MNALKLVDKAGLISREDILLGCARHLDCNPNMLVLTQLSRDAYWGGTEEGLATLRSNTIVAWFGNDEGWVEIKRRDS